MIIQSDSDTSSILKRVLWLLFVNILCILKVYIFPNIGCKILQCLLGEVVNFVGQILSIFPFVCLLHP